MTRIRRGQQFTAHLVNSFTETGQPRVIDELRRAILSGDEPPGTAIRWTRWRSTSVSARSRSARPS